MNPFLSPVFERAAAAPETPYRIILEADGQWRLVSYSDLLRRSIAFHQAFASRGIADGAVVFLVLRHGLDEHAAFLGAMLAGAVPSLLPYPNVKQDHAAYWAQHRKIFAFVRPGAIVVYDELAGQLRDCVRELYVPVLPVGEIEDCGGSLPVELPQAQSIALL